MEEDNTHVVKMNPKAVTLLCDNEEEVFTGKIASLKLLCSVLGASEPDSGVRYVNLATLVRELISKRVEVMTYSELEGIFKTLAAKVNFY